MSDQAAIGERIHQLVEAHRPELELLVDQAVEDELGRLVEQRLTAARNGNGDTPAPDPPAGPPIPTAQVGNGQAEATRTCVGACGRTLPAAAFEQGRLKCRECRRAEHREREQRRAAGEASEGYRPATPDRIAPAVLAERSRVDGRPAVPGLTAWLIEEKLAREVDGLLAPTDRCVELVAGFT